MHVYLTVWSRRLYELYRSSTEQDFSNERRVDLIGLMRLVYLYTFVLLLIVFCFAFVSNPMIYAGLHLVFAPFYALFLIFALKQQEVYTPEFIPFAYLNAMEEVGERVQRPLDLESRLLALFEEKQIWRNPDLNAEMLTRLLATNRTYLSQLIREVSKQSFRSMVNGYRIEEAKRLLMDCPEMKRVEIAERSGFSSYKTFGRAFFTYTGMTPSEYVILTKSKRFC